MSDELPKGWANATIGDVAESMKNGLYKAADSYADNGVACLRMYNIEAGKIVWKDIKRMTLTPQEVHEYQLLPGDLLVSRSAPRAPLVHSGGRHRVSLSAFLSVPSPNHGTRTTSPPARVLNAWRVARSV